MQAEIEVKFLAVNHDNVRQQLHKLGAKLETPMRLMRRIVFDWPNQALQKTGDGFLRVRDEGDKVTTTYKRFDEALSVDGAQEIETTVGSYEKMVEIYKASGMIAASEQESKRETWHYKDCEIVLDEWPWLKPYLEIEGASVDLLKSVAKELGFNWSDAVFGSVTAAYRHEYDIPRSVSIGVTPRIAFGEPVPAWLKKARKA